MCTPLQFTILATIMLPETIWNQDISEKFSQLAAWWHLRHKQSRSFWEPAA
jgi:hypothetical protein